MLWTDLFFLTLFKKLSVYACIISLTKTPCVIKALYWQLLIVCTCHLYTCLSLSPKLLRHITWCCRWWLGPRKWVCASGGSKTPLEGPNLNVAFRSRNFRAVSLIFTNFKFFCVLIRLRKKLLLMSTHWAKNQFRDNLNDCVSPQEFPYITFPCMS